MKPAKFFAVIPAAGIGRRVGGDRPKQYLEIAGRTVESSDDARRLIDAAPIGQDLKLTVLREKQRMTVTVQPVDLATRLREIRRERQQQYMKERIRFQELAPLRSP